jgi:N-methylhydantoinase B
MNMAKLDPISVATIWHYMQRVCREMRETTERTASNVLATTLHDLAYGLWDADARVIAIPEGFPCRLISSTFPIKAVLKKYGGTIRPGDVFLTNHPFLAGAVHLTDWVFIRPIFHRDALTFFTCMGTHVPDNGGARAGSHFLAFDSIAEGLNIPPIRVYEKGKICQDVVDLILANNRLPDMMKREMRALIGSTSVAEQRMISLMDRYGRDLVLGSVDEMINRTETAVRKEISKWPDGTYYAESQTDDDGLNLEERVTIRVKLTIRGDEVTFDFSDSDDQRKGNINFTYPATFSDTLCTTFLFLGTHLSSYHNEGSLKPIHVLAREGTVVHSKPGSLTAASPAITGGTIIEAVLAVMSKALPDRAIAPYAKLISPILVGRDKQNELYIYSTFSSCAGAGAVTGYDGYQNCCDLGTLGVVSKTDAEEEMVRFPWRIRRYEFMKDSHGAGKWRGAPGIVWETVNQGSDCTLIGGPWDGWYAPGEGVDGGMPTPLNKAYVLRGEEHVDISHPHVPTELEPGDVLVTECGGGAGVGAPEERDPEAVKMDVKNDLVSLEMAKEVYRVVLDADTLEIDQAATKALRRR